MNSGGNMTPANLTPMGLCLMEIMYTNVKGGLKDVWVNPTPTKSAKAECLCFFFQELLSVRTTQMLDC